jgi:hypothetical protein
MAAPALPIPPKDYDQRYFVELTRTLRLYFTGQVDVPNPVITAFSTIQTVTTGTTFIGTKDGVTLADSTLGAVNIVLPDAALSLRYQFIVKRISATGTGNVTVSATVGNIDNAASISILEQYTSVILRSDGSNYWIV